MDLPIAWARLCRETARNRQGAMAAILRRKHDWGSAEGFAVSFIGKPPHRARPAELIPFDTEPRFWIQEVADRVVTTHRQPRIGVRSERPVICLCAGLAVDRSRRQPEQQASEEDRQNRSIEFSHFCPQIVNRNGASFRSHGPVALATAFTLASQV